MKIAALLSALLLSGCGTVLYEREGSTEDQFYVEQGQCEAQAESAAVPALRRERVFDACMRGKGWRRSQ